jgi:hypothetical protein
MLDLVRFLILLTVFELLPNNPAILPYVLFLVTVLLAMLVGARHHRTHF